MTEWEGIAPPEVNDTKSFLSAVRASGLVGLGGAGFPTHVKLSLKPGAKVDTLIVNAAECEPYITVDYRQCIDEPADVLGGIYALMEYIGFTQVIIAVEDNKPDAISILNDIAQSDLGDGNKIRLMTLKSQYPQGAEKMMVLSTTGRKVPPGGLPSGAALTVNANGTGKLTVVQDTAAGTDGKVVVKSINAVSINDGDVYVFDGTANYFCNDIALVLTNGYAYPATKPATASDVVEAGKEVIKDESKNWFASIMESFTSFFSKISEFFANLFKR